MLLFYFSEVHIYIFTECLREPFNLIREWSTTFVVSPRVELWNRTNNNSIRKLLHALHTLSLLLSRRAVSNFLKGQ